MRPADIAGIFCTVIVLSYLVAMLVLHALAGKECLALGYPSAKVDFTFNMYCVKRVDQSDVVVPLRR